MLHLVVLHGDADHLADTFPLHRLLLQLAEVVVVRHHVCDDGLLVGVLHRNVCNITEQHYNGIILASNDSLIDVCYIFE